MRKRQNGYLMTIFRLYIGKGGEVNIKNLDDLHDFEVFVWVTVNTILMVLLSVMWLMIIILLSWATGAFVGRWF